MPRPASAVFGLWRAVMVTAKASHKTLCYEGHIILLINPACRELLTQLRDQQSTDRPGEMSDEIDASIVQATQQKLGKYIQRPQLTEKLLKRPPFRFLHDIVTAAIKQYGVMESVFSKQELTSDNIKEKDDKIAFLQKLIKYISAELNEELSVKPSKIVAGSEPEKTNQLLQSLALVLEQKQSNKSNKIKSSASGAVEKNNATNAKNPVKSVVNNKAIAPKKASENRAVPINAPKIESKSKGNPLRVKEPLKSGNRDSTSPIKPAKIAAVVPSSQPKTDQPAEEIETSPPDPPPDRRAYSKSRLPRATTPKLRPEETPLEPEGPPEVPLEVSTPEKVNVKPDLRSPESRINTSSAERRGKISASLSGGLRRKTQPDKEVKLDEGNIPATMEESNDQLLKSPEETPLKLSPPQSSVKNGFEKPFVPRRTPSPSGVGTSSSRPSSSNGSHQMRPKSSRRPPSRTLRNNKLTVIHQDSRPISDQFPLVIVEGNPLSDDEEDKIVQAAVFDQIVDDFSLNAKDELLNGEQGKLVEQILSAQKQLDPLTDATQDTGNAGSVTKVQSLKGLIQEMAKSALPLGHLIPLVHEDMETMYQEWQFWKKEADLLADQYNREQTVIDPRLEKLQAQLKELDSSIQDQRLKLNATRASVYRYENDVSIVISNFGKNH